MSFFSAIGNVFKGAFNAVKSLATSTLGSTIIKMAATALGGPLGGVIANAGLGLLKGGLNFKNLVKTGLDVFGGLAGNLGLSDTVKNLATAITNPTGLLSGGGLGKVLGSVLGNTGFGKTISGVLGKASGFLGNISGFGNQAGGILSKVGDLFKNLGIPEPGFLNVFSDKLNAGLGAINKIQDLINSASGILNGGNGNMLRA